MRKRKDRNPEAFGIAFLDVITCGFGAIILLLMIARVGEPVILEDSPLDLDGTVAELQQLLFEIRGESTVLNRDLTAKREQLSEFKERIARLQREKNDTEARYASIEDQTTLNSVVKDELRLAMQQLTLEMQRLLANRSQKSNDLVGGIPVDSEYIIFIIDTSGSMFRYAWPKMIDQLIATLDVYPKVKGLQIMNDMGNYMFSNYRGRWIPDTPARRRAIIQRLSTWNPFSNSSPVEGITAAIRTFYAADKKISLYVFGDEFTGPSIRSVVDTVDRINRKDKLGNPMVRIHGVGFPVQFAAPPHLQATGIRFATLMREISRKNGGTFVGLNNFR